VYATAATSASQLVWVTRQGVPEPVTDAKRLYFGPRLSPDGRRIVVQSSGDLWLYELERASFTRMTSTMMFGNSFPAWTPDGRQVLFRTNVGIFVSDVDGSGRMQSIPGTTIGDFPNSVSPDGSTLLISRQTATMSQDVYALPLRGGEVRTIISTPAFEGGAQFSSDGRWLAYVSDEASQLQVYVRPYPALDRRWQVSTEGGTAPVWSRNGRELFYRNGNKMMVVEVAAAGTELHLSRPRFLFEQSYAFGQTITIANYDVSADGQRFLMIKDDPGSGRLNVVLNWQEELRRLGTAK
jgi:Tol biopolymer transport system component